MTKTKQLLKRWLRGALLTKLSYLILIFSIIALDKLLHQLIIVFALIILFAIEFVLEYDNMKLLSENVEILK